MSLIRGILTFGSGVFVGYNIGDNTKTSEPFIKADSGGLRIGNKKIVDISEDQEKVTILDIFEFNNDFSNNKK